MMCDTGNMELINSRIAVLRNHLDMNQSEFARELGVTSTLINKLEAGKTRLTDTNIRLICFTFKVNKEWLRNGTGEMIDDNAQLSDYERQLLQFFRRLSPKARRMLIEYAEKLDSDEKAFRMETLAAAQSVPEYTTLPLEAPQGAKGEESTEKAVNPIHNKTRG
jgi:transcriptional regulator with XRE-family HTH domain